MAWLQPTSFATLLKDAPLASFFDTTRIKASNISFFRMSLRLRLPIRELPKTGWFTFLANMCAVSGFIRDISNDYLIAWLLAGALALLASVAALALPKTQLEAPEA